MHSLSQFVKTCLSNRIFAERGLWHLVRVERKAHCGAKYENEGYAGRRRRWLDADCDEPMIYKVSGNKSSAASANTPGLLIFRYPQIRGPLASLLPRDAIRHGSRRDSARSNVVWVINPRSGFWNGGDAAILGRPGHEVGIRFQSWYASVNVHEKSPLIRLSLQYSRAQHEYEYQSWISAHGDLTLISSYL